MVATVAMLHVMTRKPGRKKRGKMMGEEGRWDLRVMKREGGRESEGEGEREREGERATHRYARSTSVETQSSFDS